MTSSVNKIVDSLPFPTIICIEGQLTHKTIEELNSQLNANTASVKSNLGKGGHVHLVLSVLPTVLATLTPMLIIIPINPGPNADIPPRQTVVKIESIWLDHTNTTKLFIKYNNMDNVLKQ